ncbi:MAG: hypothetical protein GC162_02300 [Planctomycetes bacterium]|nr:hypothetical protein [Planctomycetota bacterium]
MGYTRKSSGHDRAHQGEPHFQHWYRDNQAYFITARCHERFPAFASEAAKVIFWRQFEKYTAAHHFEPWATSLIDNHYHAIGYLHRGDDLAPMMRKIHGSVAKLVNDQLESEYKTGGLKSPRLVNGRLSPFWHDSKSKTYFDGCLRDDKQGRAAYRYVLIQPVRHGVCEQWEDYPHTRIRVDIEQAMRFARARGAFLEGVKYRRYEGGGT